MHILKDKTPDLYSSDPCPSISLLQFSICYLFVPKHSDLTLSLARSVNNGTVKQRKKSICRFLQLSK